MEKTKPKDFGHFLQIIQPNVGSIDSPLVVAALRAAKMDIDNIVYDQEDDRIFISNVDLDVFRKLQNNLLLQNKKTITGRDFNIVYDEEGKVARILLSSYNENNLQSNGIKPNTSIVSQKILPGYENRNVQYSIDRLQSHEDKDLLTLHTVLVAELKKALSADKSVVLLIGEQHESLKSLQAHLLLLLELKKSGLPVGEVILEPV